MSKAIYPTVHITEIASFLLMTECFSFTLSVMSTEMETSYINGQLTVDN